MSLVEVFCYAFKLIRGKEKVCFLQKKEEISLFRFDDHQQTVQKYLIYLLYYIHTNYYFCAYFCFAKIIL